MARRTVQGPKFLHSRDVLLFSQRDEDIEDCAALVDDFTTRVLILHGSSGSGKSSFIRAGLIPRLELAAEASCSFFFLRQASDTSEPLLIRATDDPVARIHHSLQAAAKNDQRIPPRAREGMLTALAGDPPYDRLAAMEKILAALTALTASLRDTFVLLVDQAEEILTLPAEGDAKNRRKAFFTLLEGICFSRIDMRAVVSLRTEYYGRFCSFFHIRPTISLTAAAETRAGLVDFLLRGFSGANRIAAAIRWPTFSSSGCGAA